MAFHKDSANFLPFFFSSGNFPDSEYLDLRIWVPHATPFLGIPHP